MKIKPNTTISHYKILSELGKGGMGEVYLAEDTKLDRKVAIKFLSAEFGKDEDKLKRFIQEAKATSALNHPNIITVHEIDSIESTHYIATEFIEGETLREKMSGNDSIPLNSILRIGIETAEALSAAHAEGIAHRDIKPDNIMVRKDGYVKVLDFGLAKLTEAKSKGIVSFEGETKALVETNPGVVMGTVSYMSPEQARGKPTDEKTDIWSLGVVLYETLAGKVPFEGETINHTIVAILETEPKLLENVPDELQRIVRKTLTKEKQNRYQTSRDVLIDLKNLRRELDLQGELERSIIPNTAEEEAKSTGDNETQAFAAKSIEKTNAENPETENQNNAVTNSSSLEYVAAQAKSHKIGAGVALVVAAIVLSVFGYGLYQLIKSPNDQTSRTSDSLKTERLTGDGKTFGAVISPDGKFLAFSKSGDLWLRQIETNSEVELAAKGEFPNGIYFFAFSPDGNFVYFNGDKPEDESPNVYRVPTLGGRYVKVLSDAIGVSFSPDGKQIAFRRGNPNQHVLTSIYVANIDGSGERKLASLSDTKYFNSRPVWSPDGNFLTAIMGDDARIPEPKFIPVIISVSDGKIRNLGERYFSVFSGLAWHPEDEIIYVSASEERVGSQLWEIEYPSGESRRLTQSTSTYDGISITADGKSLATVDIESRESIWVSPDLDPKNAKEIMPDNSDTRGMSWTPDGNIVYISDQSGYFEFWIMDRAGKNPKQLTNDRKFKADPKVSPDGRFIVYYGPGQQIFRISIDGGSPLQLTADTGGGNPEFSPDGKWIIYSNWIKTGSAILRMPIDGGTPQQLTDYPSADPRYSPDGKFFACSILDEKTQRWNRIAIVSAEGGSPNKVLELPATAYVHNGPVWTPDGKNVTYFDSNDEGLWLQPIDGGPPKKLEAPKSRSTELYRREYSRDGKQIAVVMGKSLSNAILITDFR